MSRKREAVYQKVKDQTAGYLRGVTKKIQRRKFAEGLTALDQLVPQVEKTEYRSRIISLSGDSEFLQGKFSDAAQIYAQAIAIALEEIKDPRTWVRPLIGQVLSLLKDVRVEEAVAVARQGWDRVLAQYQAHQQWLHQHVNEQLTQGGKVQVGKRPIRPSVLGARLGQLFFQEGEIQYAKEFFQKAISFNPQGGCRARIGLAKAALRENNPLDALMKANEALRLGKFSAKTLSAWKLLIEANQRLERKGVEADLLQGLWNIKGVAVRARAILEIVQSLRGYGDEAWKEIANEWLQKEGKRHPIIEAEIKKLFFAKARLEKDSPDVTADAAVELLHTRKLSAVEHLCATKELVRSRLLAGHQIRLESLVEQGGEKYGKEFGPKLRHGIALACMMAKQHDRARGLLQQNVETVSPVDSQWGRSVWALARMEELFKNHAIAAELYQKLYQEEKIPLRIQLQARLGWARNLIAAGNPEPIAAAKNEILTVLEPVKDWELLLDFGRQLNFAIPELQSLQEAIYQRGTTLALKAFQDAQHPAEALKCLFRLTRRQVTDFGKYNEALAAWQSLGNSKLDWLWTENTEFWEYIALICQALLHSKQTSGAFNLASKYLNDSATPIEGKASIGITLALWQIQNQQVKEALNYFKEIVQKVPAHPLCAHAYYWLAIKAWNEGDKNKSQDYARNILSVIGNRQGYLWEWKSRGYAMCLLGNLDVQSISGKDLNYNDEKLLSLIQQIQQDLESLK